ncbi:MAG TPA: response regulator transcription factor [Actinobacteria bacterium]|nr:response regulator transcription factor [Actinomycetota bacterium]
MRILVVEDEAELADAVQRGLQREGYAVDVAYEGDEGLDKLSYTSYDLICLDLNLPGTDGREIARQVRAGLGFGDEPPRILMLTARDSLDDRVAGLDDGADDYLVKPFQFAELAARVRALLRRDAGRSGAILTVGSLELDAARHRATRHGQPLDLTAKEFALLRYLMLHSGQVLTAERLLEHVWDEHADPFTNTVRVTVSNLRRKLGDEQPIETVVGSGYRLTENG